MRGEVRIITVFQGSAGSLNVKRLLLIKENQITQAKKFSIFLCMARVCAHWNHSFDIHLSHLGPVFCFHILNILRSHHRKGLESDGRQMTGILSFLSSLRLTSSSSMVAAIAGDCNTLVYWHGRKCSISHFLKKKKKYGKKTKWLSEEALQIVEKMR